MKKRILFVCQQPPYGSSLAKEALDAILAASVYEQDVAVIFMGAGIYQLLREQAPSTIAMKSFNKIMAAFALYEIKNIFVDANALTHSSLTPEQLSDNIKTVSPKEIQSLMQQYDVIVPF